MGNLRMNEIFVVDMIDLLGLNNLSFFEELECNEFSILLILSNFDFAEPAYDQ